jgi:hypothetical protein
MVELCTLVSFIVIIGGGVQRRVAGWQVAVGALMFSALVQCAGMAIVVRSHLLEPGSSTAKKILTPPGLPLQQQPPLLRRLGARHLLSPRHSIVDHPPRPIPRHTLQRPVPPCRRRLRAHTRPVPGRC